MTILLIDDEPLALEMLKDSVAEACPDAVLHPFLKTSEALAFLQANPVDIAFLDIQMRHERSGNGCKMQTAISENQSDFCHRL